MAPSQEDNGTQAEVTPQVRTNIESNRSPEKPLGGKAKNKKSGGDELLMKNFSHGTRGGRRVLTMAGATRFTDNDGKEIILYSGDTAYVPAEVKRRFNSGKQTFVAPMDPVPQPGDPG